MPETKIDTTSRLRSILASSVKAGHPSDPIGLLAGKAKFIRTKGRNDGVVEVVATTDDVDLDDEVIVPTGADTEYFKRNASVFIDHCTRMESRVGVALAIRPWPSGLDQRGWLVDISMDPTDAARDVIAKCQNGGMGVSIGFRAIDRGTPTPDEVKRYSRAGKAPRSIVREWEWLELSFTPMPCNVACRVLSTPDAPEVEAAPAPRKAKRQIVVCGDAVFTRRLAIG
jgi:phage head maturation protease